SRKISGQKENAGPLTAGARIGPYEIKSPLGEGGMGVVFRALDTKLHREVALKLLPDHFADDPERLARFQRDTQVLASLKHPNVARIDWREGWTAQTCSVMGSVVGETLQERLRRGAIPTGFRSQAAGQMRRGCSNAAAEVFLGRALTNSRWLL